MIISYPKIALMESSLLDAVVALDHNAMPFSWTKEQWLQEARVNQRLFVLAQSGESDAVMGFSLLSTDTLQAQAYLLKMVFAPVWRGRGLANDLWMAVEKKLLSLSANKSWSIHLHVQEDNHRAVSWYERQGFISDGVVRCYYGNGDNAIAMSKKLFA